MKYEKVLIIQGTRGIPAKHGGFETFAERFSEYMVSKGWRVIVYCQVDERSQVGNFDWKGVSCINIFSSLKGALGTVYFDLISIIHSLRIKGIVLTLGYNTAIFNILYLIFFRANIINMDGIEWRRNKWSFFARFWLRVNEQIAIRVGKKLIADHPEISKYLEKYSSVDKILMIPYGADSIDSSLQLQNYWIDRGLKKLGYSVVIARPEPENSIYEIVHSFSKVRRNHKLVILGKFVPDENEYHRKVISAASPEVLFVGPVYDKDLLASLRSCCMYYLHGHQVGGTNPSLVEALGAGCAIIAHDNHFNRWVSDNAAIYFSTCNDLENIFDNFFIESESYHEMKNFSRIRHESQFQWISVFQKYEKLLETYI